MAETRHLEKYLDLLRKLVSKPADASVAEASAFGQELLAQGVPPDEVLQLHREALARLSAERPGLSLKDSVEPTCRPLAAVMTNYCHAFQRQIADSEACTVALREEVERRKQTEAVLEARSRELADSNAELQQFASAASHDLKAPLKQISAFADLLAKTYKGKLDTSADEFIRFMVAGTRRMEELLTDLVVYARLNRAGLQSGPVDTGEILAQVQADLGQAIADAEATIVMDSPMPAVKGVKSQVRSLFQNLLDNAVKYRDKERKPEIHVGAERDGDFWRFQVRDNGIGIQEKYFGRIFEVFQRLHTVSEYPGTGVGLAICKKVVGRGEGRIWVESQPGAGSTFCFTLPAADGTS
jgi:light-regulated signal transduction histidine kinase (bacteriophytochrome)